MSANELARHRAVEALRKIVPELAGDTIRELGKGLEHTTFVAGDLVLRVTNGRSITLESHLLERLRHRLSVAIPNPLFADEDVGVMAYPLISGESLLGRRAGLGIARRLGGILRELHAIDPLDVGDLVPVDAVDPSEWLEDLDGPPELMRIVRTSVPEPPPHRVLAHADLGAEHILEHGGTITGVIDWSDAAITDPAVDFARPYRDFGPRFLTEMLASYGGLDDPDAAMRRITFYARCAALEDLAFGRALGRSVYRLAAQRSLAWLFSAAAP